MRITANVRDIHGSIVNVLQFSMLEDNISDEKVKGIVSYLIDNAETGMLEQSRIVDRIIIDINYSIS